MFLFQPDQHNIKIVMDECGNDVERNGFLSGMKPKLSENITRWRVPATGISKNGRTLNIFQLWW